MKKINEIKIYAYIIFSIGIVSVARTTYILAIMDDYEFINVTKILLRTLFAPYGMLLLSDLILSFMLRTNKKNIFKTLDLDNTIIPKLFKDQTASDDQKFVYEFIYFKFKNGLLSTTTSITTFQISLSLVILTFIFTFDISHFNYLANIIFDTIVLVCLLLVALIRNIALNRMYESFYKYISAL